MTLTSTAFPLCGGSVYRSTPSTSRLPTIPFFLRHLLLPLEHPVVLLYPRHRANVVKHRAGLLPRLPPPTDAASSSFSRVHSFTWVLSPPPSPLLDRLSPRRARPLSAALLRLRRRMLLHSDTAASCIRTRIWMRRPPPSVSPRRVLPSQSDNIRIQRPGVDPPSTALCVSATYFPVRMTPVSARAPLVASRPPAARLHGGWDAGWVQGGGGRGGWEAKPRHPHSRPHPARFRGPSAGQSSREEGEDTGGDVGEAVGLEKRGVKSVGGVEE
ncbi:hypothetical protein B0H11DRAFT_2246891 [Mycena galericulata]|nr:hypothetical protein B0H11DRAFT_2246891 [Mycena galericulata]